MLTAIQALKLDLTPEHSLLTCLFQLSEHPDNHSVLYWCIIKLMKLLSMLAVIKQGRSHSFFHG